MSQRVVVPRIKAWIKKVVTEREEEAEKEEKQSSKVAEEAAEAAKAAASAAALVAKASQDLLSSRSEGFFRPLLCTYFLSYSSFYFSSPVVASF